MYLWVKVKLVVVAGKITIYNILRVEEVSHFSLELERCRTRYSSSQKKYI